MAAASRSPASPVSESPAPWGLGVGEWVCYQRRLRTNRDRRFLALIRLQCCATGLPMFAQDARGKVATMHAAGDSKKEATH